jgi:hypothetical protein
MKGPRTTNAERPAHSVEHEQVEIPIGWRYKGSKLGPITLPWYASPESQLILVSFVCFLCPGKAAKYDTLLQATDNAKACSTLSMALVVEDSLALMLTTPRILRFTLLSLLSVSSPAPSSTPSASEFPSHSGASDTAFISAHICATATPRISVTLSLPASCLDAAQAFSGPLKVRL